ncbi:hypothetical protein G7061_03035 [Erysipelothrix sp. HDW6B]|uniref:hypothetical protein n=1 Tax=Erysipelothrix sp. HDW6B TaxID=2714929 RepID=UPI00140C7FDA|nr:hypothetical protein [Erysipelothrix sp. HDW6B]QIK85646.1 hypothetical protein G7061_03035 [Erysipelothrix sp. HDW6B]
MMEYIYLVILIYIAYALSELLKENRAVRTMLARLTNEKDYIENHLRKYLGETLAVELEALYALKKKTVEGGLQVVQFMDVDDEWVSLKILMHDDTWCDALVKHDRILKVHHKVSM